MTHPSGWGMISLSQYAWRPYMHREILPKTMECIPCTEIGKNLKPVVPKSKWHPQKACQEPNEKIQIDFGGPILNEKPQEIYSLTCMDRYSTDILQFKFLRKLMVSMEFHERYA